MNNQEQSHIKNQQNQKYLPLNNYQNQQPSTTKHLPSIIYLSIIILIYQSISNTQLGILSQFTHQNGNDWIGPLSTSLLFLGSGIASTYNKYIVKYKNKFKYIFFIGSFGYTLFILLGVVFLKIGFSIEVQIFIIVGSFLSGVVISAFYNAQFNYVNICSQQDNQRTKYFGLSMCIVQSANILGNTISSLLIERLGQFMYAVAMNISVFIISLGFLKIKSQWKIPQKQQIEQIKLKIHIENQCQNKIHEQSLILTQNLLIKNIKNSDYNSQQKKQQQPQNQCKTSKINQYPPFLIIFIFAFSGIILTYVFCYLSIIYYQTYEHLMNEQELNKITFIAFIIEGIGQFCGGLIVYFLQNYKNQENKINNKIKFFLNKNNLNNTYCWGGGLFIIAILFMQFISFQQSNSQFLNQIILILMYSCGFLIGFCDCLCFSLALSIAGKWSQNGITFFNLGQSGTVAFTTILLILVSFNSYFLVFWCAIVYILSIIGIKYKLEQKKQKNIRKIVQNE